MIRHINRLLRSRAATVSATDAADAGLACLAMVAAHHRRDGGDLATLRARRDETAPDTPIHEFIGLARSLGLAAHPRRATPEAIERSPLPCVLHWGARRFAVVERVTSEGLSIVDPMRGRYTVTYDEAGMYLSGLIVELTLAHATAPATGSTDTTSDTMSLPSRSVDVLSLLDLGGHRSMPVVLQSEAAECGLACLAMVAAHHGQRRDMSTLRRHHDVGLQGLTLRGLIEVADRMGFSCRPVRAELEALDELTLPCVLHWDMRHFVVLERVRRGRLHIVDPAGGRRVCSLVEASPHFTGVALELTPSERFERREDVRRVRISDLWQRVIGLKRSLGQTLLLAALLQLLLLLAPLLNQLVVDEAIVQGDLHLVTVLAIGFSLLLLISTAIRLLRDHVVLHLSSSMTFQMQVNLFRHLLRLPRTFFAKRHVGDIQARFASLEPIESLLTTTLIGAVLDGLMAITTIVVISIYSWKLTLIVLALVTLHVLGTLLVFPIVRARTEQQIRAGAVEQTTFLEIVRAIGTIKSFGRESERTTVWQNALAEEINHEVRLSKIGMWSESAESLLFGLGNIAILALGATLVIDGELTLGMLLAFLLYQSQFTQRAQALVESLFELRMVGLHLERLADIVHAEAEDDHVDERSDGGRLRGEIELEGVGYRYGTTDPYVLKGVDLRIEAGECVLIRGHSGSGKSTLMKLMSGLVPPSEGTVRIDGQPLEAYGTRRFRRQSGFVMQDDTLLSGSLAENIAFFDPEVDRERVERCARVAVIHDTIMQMPMRYETLVGDMGSSLSGGQRQRVLLARALYQQPAILFMDEGTANLDADTAERIIDNLARLDITRVFISHDDSALGIEGCRLLWLAPGGLLFEDEEIAALDDPLDDAYPETG